MDLSFNQLEVFPVNSFCELIFLNRLDLSLNFISNLDKNMLSCVNNRNLLQVNLGLNPVYSQNALINPNFIQGLCGTNKKCKIEGFQIKESKISLLIKKLEFFLNTIGNLILFRF